MKIIYPEHKFKDGEPCYSKSCRYHTKTPCHTCERIGMKGYVDMDEVWDRQFDNFENSPDNPLNILFGMDRTKAKRVRSSLVHFEEGELQYGNPISLSKFNIKFFENLIGKTNEK